MDKSLFLSDVEDVFKKHGKPISSALQKHLSGLDGTFSSDSRDYADTDKSQSPVLDTGGTSGESYQDESDPAHPWGNAGIGSVGGGQMEGYSAASSLAEANNANSYMKYLLSKKIG